MRKKILYSFLLFAVVAAFAFPALGYDPDFHALFKKIGNTVYLLKNRNLDVGGSLSVGTSGSEVVLVGAYTVANIPGSPSDGDIIVVTDGDGACDTTTGGGSDVSIHRYNGASWDCLGDGGAGAVQLDGLSDVTGEGTVTYVLQDDGDGTYSFVAPTDARVTALIGNGDGGKVIGINSGDDGLDVYDKLNVNGTAQDQVLISGASPFAFAPTTIAEQEVVGRVTSGHVDGIAIDDTPENSSAKVASSKAVYDERAATTTLTNKTIDGDDNTVQDLPHSAIKTIVRSEFIPIGWFVFDGTGDPGDETEEDNIRYRDFASDATEEGEFGWQIPSDLTGSTIKVRALAVITNATAPADTEGVSWGISAVSIASDESHDTATGTEVYSEDTDLDDSAGAQWDIVYFPYVEVTPTGLAAGEWLKVAVNRDHDNTDDTYGQDIGLIGVEIKWQEDPGTMAY